METLDPSPAVSDEVKCTTCYMCACRCGIRVHLKDGSIRYIEGNRDHPVNRGVLCAKGSAGIMQHLSPARLRKPLRRVGPRGSGEFEEIEWDEAIETACTWLAEVRQKDPTRLAFFTGRDQSQALTGWWAQAYGTPNFAAHGGFCSVNMAAAGLYTLGGSFWEFGEADFERARLFLMFGVAEDHDSNPIKIGLSKLKERGATFISVNPVRTGYSAVADEWLPVRPGTDGALVLALVHELLRTRRVDLDFLRAYTNAPWLLIDDPGGAEHGLFARDAAGKPLVADAAGALHAWDEAGITPALTAAVTLPDGRQARPVFVLMAETYLDEKHGAEAASLVTGIPAARIRSLAARIAEVAFEETITVETPWTDWRGVRHERFVGRPVSFHAMRGISAHANGFQTCRALHVLQLLLGAIDGPGAWRYKSPYPRPTPPPIRPGGKLGETGPGKSLPRPPLGFPMGPDDLLVDERGRALRLDKAYSWDAPVAAHGLMHLVIRNAWAGDPYPVDVLFMYMANMAWNSAMNSAGTVRMLTDTHPDGTYKIPRIIYADAFASETVAYADLVLPDTTYLERYDAISLLDRPIGNAEGPGDAIRHPVVAPDRDVRPFQDVLLDLGARLGLPGMVKEDGAPKFPGGYADYIVNHERTPGVGPLAGWRGADGGKVGKGEPNPGQLDRYIANGGFWKMHLPDDALYMKFANRAYLDHAVAMGFMAKPEPIVLQLYVEPLQRFRLAAMGHGEKQPPDHLRARIIACLDPLPVWYPPFEGAAVPDAAFPLHAVTQRPAAMYHSWGSQNAWLRQLHGENRLYMNRGTGEALGIADDDWVHVTSHHGRITVQARLMEGVEANTVWTWNAIGKRAGAWALDPRAPEAMRGFLLNHLISEHLPEADGGGGHLNADPVTGQAAWYDLRVRVEKAALQPAATEPSLPPLKSPPHVSAPKGPLRFGAAFGRSPENRAKTS
jgi:anaerobic selenocysteine-containing dehydrogenase